MREINLLKKSNLAVVEMFRKDVFLSRTIRGISGMLKKPYPKVYGAVKELEAGNILSVRRVGGSKVCELSFSEEAISMLAFLDEQEGFSRKIPNIEKILGLKEIFDDIILVMGSYAKNKQTKASDIDLAVLTKNEAIKKQRLLENFTSLFLPRLHVVALTYDDFVKMLLDKEENYGKELFKAHLLFRNAGRYYHLVREAREHGFRA